MAFTLRSTAFHYGDPIPVQYTCMGDDLSPGFSWSGAPGEARTLALIADDPDAPGGTWTHWVLWNVPLQPALLAEGLPAHAELDSGARQGKNDFGRIGYGGPCPPPGKTHRYFFMAFALDTRLEVKAGATRRELEAALKRHVVAHSDWMGTFRR